MRVAGEREDPELGQAHHGCYESFGVASLGAGADQLAHREGASNHISK